MTPDEARIAYEERKRINDHAWGMREHYFEMRKAHHYDSDEFKRLSDLAIAAPEQYGYDLRDYNEKMAIYELLSMDPDKIDRCIWHLSEAHALIPNHEVWMFVDGHKSSQARRLELLAMPIWPLASASPAPDSP